MPKIGYVLSDATAIARLRAAFPAEGRLVSLASGQLETEGLPTDLEAIVFGPEAVQHHGRTFFASLKARTPSLALVAYVPLKSEYMRAAFELGHDGVDALCILGIDDHPAGLRDVIQAASVGVVARRIRSVLPPMTPALARSAVERSLLGIPDLKTARDLARTVGLPLPHLRRELGEAGLPAPNRLLSWCRILVGSKLLEDPGRTSESVGLWLDYASGPAFRNACRIVAGATPTQIRDAGGLEFLLSRFSQQLQPRRRRQPLAG